MSTRFSSLILTVVFVLTIFSNSVLADDASTRIVGGDEASDGEYPWAVALIFDGFSNTAGQFCGGTLIADKWVLTAAHCMDIFSSPSQFDVFIGDNNLASPDATRHEVERFIIHPDFNSVSLVNDIALIELKTSASQEKAKLPTSNIQSVFGDGVLATVIGWGATSEGGDASQVLLEVDVPIVSDSECKDAYGESTITDVMICAGFEEGGKDSCQGDSGGGLLGEVGGDTYVIGVVSFGTGCARPGLPGVYAKVVEFVSWIEDIMAGGDGDSGGDDDDDSGGGGSGGGGVGGGGDNEEECVPDTEAGCSCIDADVAPSISGSDSDGDGVSNTQENTDGTDSSDAGSYQTHLGSTVYAMWTGFLDITNVLEIVNIGATDVSVTLKFYQQDGTACSTVSFTVEPNEQRDVFVNALAGFEQNNYGVVSIAYSGGTIDGRMSYYRNEFATSGGAGIYDFAYSIPLTNPVFGESTVSFNTFQPSARSADSRNLVANWLSIVNLDNVRRFFHVITYDQSGTVIARRLVTVAPRAREDIDGGHGLVGSRKVGKHAIIPTNGSTPYISFLTRFGYNVPANKAPTGFTFAFPLLAKPGSGQTQYVPLNTSDNSDNWLEVVNFQNSIATATLVFYNASGTAVDTRSIAIAPHSQIHYSANSRIGNSTFGNVAIIPDSGTKLVAQSMVYTRDASTGAIQSVYGSQANEEADSESVGSYNRFVSMDNILRLFNATNSTVAGTVTVRRSGSSSNQAFSLPPHGATQLLIEEGDSFGTSEDTYGIIEVDTGDSSENVFSEVVRVRREDGVDFFMRTDVR